MNTWDLSEVQAEAILNMRLRALRLGRGRDQKRTWVANVEKTRLNKLLKNKKSGRYHFWADQ